LFHRSLCLFTFPYCALPGSLPTISSVAPFNLSSLPADISAPYIQYRRCLPPYSFLSSRYFVSRRLWAIGREEAPQSYLAAGGFSLLAPPTMATLLRRQGGVIMQAVEVQSTFSSWDGCMSKSYCKYVTSACLSVPC
jgi:hypothetical protein